MDKQAYKELWAEEMIKSAEYKHRLDVIWKIIEDNPNDYALGKEIRQLYWKDWKEKESKSS
tara:strand:+ start:784 stop:966 length:183 start_codon:yes stop_codon:yes gene_type:complete